jgi:hypothetical protein
MGAEMRSGEFALPLIDVNEEKMLEEYRDALNATREG